MRIEGWEADCRHHLWLLLLEATLAGIHKLMHRHPPASQRAQCCAICQRPGQCSWRFNLCLLHPCQDGQAEKRRAATTCCHSKGRLHWLRPTRCCSGKQPQGNADRSMSWRQVLFILFARLYAQPQTSEGRGTGCSMPTWHLSCKSPPPQHWPQS